MEADVVLQAEGRIGMADEWQGHEEPPGSQACGMDSKRIARNLGDPFILLEGKQ